MTATTPFLTYPDSILVIDREALSGLSDDEARRIWIASRVEEYRNSALALLSFHNDIAPIHRALSTELLSQVFSYCWQDTRSIAVAHVCRHWRAIALKTASLWAAAIESPGKQLSFNCRNPSLLNSRGKFAAFALKRSFPQPLRIKVHHFPRSFALTLGPHANRLVDLYVHLDGAHQLRYLSDVLATGAPDLETLGITFPGHLGMHKDWDSTCFAYDDQVCARSNSHAGFGIVREGVKGWKRTTDSQKHIKGTPRLKSLRCIPIDLLPHFVTPTLREICVTPAQFDRDHVKGFVNALVGCPDLERLKLWMVNDYCPMYDSNVQGIVEELIPDPDSPLWAAAGVVNLPSLQAVVANVGTDSSHMLYLDCVTFPQSTSLDIITKDSKLRDLFTGHALPARRIQEADAIRLSDSCQPFNSKWETEVVMFKGDAASIRITRTRSEGPDCDPLPASETLDDCVALLREHGTNVARIILHQRGFYGKLDILGPFPSITSLEIAGPCFDEVLPALLVRPQRAPNTQPGVVVCPNLKSLVVSFPRDYGWLQRTMKRKPTRWEEMAAVTLWDDQAELVKVLESRAAKGLRLERLEWQAWEWDNVCKLEAPPQAIAHTLMPRPGLVVQSALEKFVDGPVVFGGVTYLELPTK
ncbi:uncharacterized protein BXZ73DRAFT_81660 [Epithele typhae]|uniref:uncharacterized protein n=1 Tax=Epithele typhae TaxID=378194 RepID=UPI0020072B0F|nr:uncharacterized protein BXZ73DRAFT_81660 [Epithele typhae]KAH9914522.1 hypothetical protein BXZ73DRAFT_81660 [Epithele typhae]